VGLQQGGALSKNERGRFSALRKRDAVLRLLGGEVLESVATDMGVRQATVRLWRTQLLERGLAGLRSPDGGEPAIPIERLRHDAVQLTVENELLEAKIRAMEADVPLLEAAEAMTKVVSSATNKTYTLAQVCRIWKVPRSSVYLARARKHGTHPPARRRGPVGPCHDLELVGRIRQVLMSVPTQRMGYRKVWAQLRDDGTRTSKERVRRLMREHGLQAAAAPRSPSRLITTGQLVELSVVRAE
jgi:transposase-like protein